MEYKLQIPQWPENERPRERLCQLGAEYLSDAEALGIRDWIRFDLTIVRGLAYYTGIVFELFDAVGEARR